MDTHPDVADPRRIIAVNPELAALQAVADAQGTSAWCAQGKHHHCKGHKMQPDYSFTRCVCACHQSSGT